MSYHHELKIHPQYFHHVKIGNKNFEHRVNDRGFQTGDTVSLMEYNPEIEHCDDELGGFDCEKGFTGNSLQFRIGYVHQVGNAEVVFSLIELEEK